MRRAATIALLVAAVSRAAAQAPALDAAMARALFQEGRHADAAAVLAALYVQHRDPWLLEKEALCREGTGDFAAALALYERLRRDHSPLPESLAGRVAAGEARARDALDNAPVHVTFMSVPGAIIRTPAAEGPAPLRAKLRRGTHAVSVEAPGRAPLVTDVSIREPGQIVELSPPLTQSRLRVTLRGAAPSDARIAADSLSAPAGNGAATLLLPPGDHVVLCGTQRARDAATISLPAHGTELICTFEAPNTLRLPGWLTLAAGVAVTASGAGLLGHGTLLEQQGSASHRACDGCEVEIDAGWALVGAGTSAALTGAVLLILDALEEPVPRIAAPAPDEAP